MSGSKSQPGSGVPAAAFANRSEKCCECTEGDIPAEVSAPSAILALKVAGLHTSKAATAHTTVGAMVTNTAKMTRLA
jgi:hypothetical protein